MRLIVGLGNPGPRFEHTRHNVGFDVVRRVAQLEGVRLRKRFLKPYLRARTEHLFLALPLTYMNRSGSVIPDLLTRASADPADLVVVCDNMDLPPGTVKLKRRGSSRNHNGIASVMDAIGSGAFTRLYVGVGRPAESGHVVDHVLSVPPDSERDAYDAAIDRASRTLLMLSSHSIDQIMNLVNQGP